MKIFGHTYKQLEVDMDVPIDCTRDAQSLVRFLAADIPAKTVNIFIVEFLREFIGNFTVNQVKEIKTIIKSK